MFASISLLLFFVSLTFANAVDPIVSTDYGKIQGFCYKTAKGFHSEIFLGIPFAKPPIGDLRFEKPQPPTPWKLPLVAKSYGIACASHVSSTINRNTSEDCLTLNILKPRSPSLDPNGYPVIIFIHGGGFVTGSSSDYNYKQIVDKLVSNSVILISINYRLGPFGFFSTGTSTFPGNYGLWDQIEALKFIQKVIPDFNGNPFMVSIIGTSAGAASVSALTLSHVTKDLFLRAISMGGTALFPWASSKEVIENSVSLFKETHCYFENNSKECLKKKTTAEIIKAQTAKFQFPSINDNLNFIPYYPIIDNDLFNSSSMEEAIQTAPKRNHFMGFCRQEYSVLAINHYNNQTNNKYMPIPLSKTSNFTRDDFITGVKTILDDIGSKNQIIEFYETQKSFYTKNMYLQIYAQLFSDIVFNIPQMREAMQKSAAGHNVYFYVYDFVPDGLRQPHFEHAGHGAEHINIFGTIKGHPTPNWMDSDVAKVQKTFVDLLINFVKYGIPSSKNIIVPKINGSESYKLPFINISSELIIDNNLWPTRRQFWKEISIKNENKRTFERNLSHEL